MNAAELAGLIAAVLIVVYNAHIGGKWWRSARPRGPWL
jgi:hypothetical protein